ncbi:MAG: ribulose-phosphate 3-epimerase [Patescibacteria group bacterium]|jgi:ribulose-phosphate 3-epimerase
MRTTILPSIIATSQKEFTKTYNKIKDLKTTYHLDFMEKPFVKNESLNFPVELPQRSYQVHLMTKDIEDFIEENHTKAKMIIFHIEATKSPKKIINRIRKLSPKTKIGIAINPRTPIQKIIPFIKSIDMALIMTVQPGQYGAPFVKSTIKKVKKLRDKYPRLTIQVDGSINEKTIEEVKKAGANSFVVGSYLQKSRNAGKAIHKLKELIK